jgi:hypothetical protein
MVHYRLLPVSLQEGMRRYIEFGIRPGSFLCAVLENDLNAAVVRADYDNMLSLSRVMMFMRSEAPTDAWGSRAAVEAWLDSHARREQLLREAPAVNV